MGISRKNESFSDRAAGLSDKLKGGFSKARKGKEDEALEERGPDSAIKIREAKKKRSNIGPLAVILAALFFYLIPFQFAMSARSSRLDDKKTFEEESQVLQKQVNDAKVVQANVERYGEFLTVIGEAIPESAETDQLISIYAGVAEQTGVRITNISNGRPLATEGEGGGSRTVESVITVEGNILAVGTFLDELREVDRVLTVSSLRGTAADTSDNLSIRVTVLAQWIDTAPAVVAEDDTSATTVPGE